MKLNESHGQLNLRNTNIIAVVHLEINKKKIVHLVKKFGHRIIIQPIKYNEQSHAKLCVFLDILKKNHSHFISFKQISEPKLSNIELTAINPCIEHMMINIELQPFITIKRTCLENSIGRGVYNKCKRKLFDQRERVRQCISAKFSHLNSLFIISPKVVKKHKYYQPEKRKSNCYHFK